MRRGTGAKVSVTGDHVVGLGTAGQHRDLVGHPISSDEAGEPVRRGEEVTPRSQGPPGGRGDPSRRRAGCGAARRRAATLTRLTRSEGWWHGCLGRRSPWVAVFASPRRSDGGETGFLSECGRGGYIRPSRRNSGQNAYRLALEAAALPVDDSPVDDSDVLAPEEG